MNIIEFINKSAKRQEIISRLTAINEELNGGACFSPDLRPGKATGFLVYHLQEYFSEILKKDFEVYLEVGVLYGGSLCSLYDSGFEGTAYGLDIYEGYYGNFNNKNFSDSEGHKKLVSDNVEKFGGNPILIKANTQKEDFDDLIDKQNIKDLDVLMIDGDHSYKGAINDYYKLIKFLKIGGFVLFDNYEMKGVQKAVEEVISSGQVKNLGVWNKTCWIGIKR